MDRSNFLLWQNLAWPILRSYGLEGYLTGDKSCPSKFVTQEFDVSERSSAVTATTVEQRPNPAYQSWVAVDQLVLEWMYNSMSPEIATQVMGFQTSKELWEAVQQLFEIQSRVEVDYM